jgi:GMP synthase (glutamine-hydrolysing)
MITNIHQHRILILDFGSQYAQLIARRVRECGVYCELMHPSVSDEVIKQFNPNGIILSGGPETVVHHHTPRAPKIIFELGWRPGPYFGKQSERADIQNHAANTNRNIFYDLAAVGPRVIEDSFYHSFKKQDTNSNFQANCILVLVS